MLKVLSFQKLKYFLLAFQILFILFLLFNSQFSSAQVCLPLNGYLVWSGPWEPGRIPMASSSTYVLTASPFYVYQGKVGLNTKTPVYTLQVYGDISGNRLCIGSDCRSAWPSGGITGSGSQNQVAFWTDTNNLSGSNNLLWDDTTSKLQVNGNIQVNGNVVANNFLGTINASNVSAGTFGSNTGGGNYSFLGNVGIGTTAPRANLEVRGLRNSTVSTTTAVSAIGGGDVYLYINAMNSNPWGVWMQVLNNVGSPFPLVLNPNGGNVGIGTTAPTQKLHVAGNARVDGEILFPNTDWGLGRPQHWIHPHDKNMGFFIGDLPIAGIPTSPYDAVGVTIYDGAPGRYFVVAGENNADGIPTEAKFWVESDGDAYIKGNVGIGTTAPQRKLEIGGDVAGISFESSPVFPHAGAIRFGDNSGWKLYFGRSRESPGGKLNIGTVGVLMTIHDKGNVGIGTTAPLAKLHIEGGTTTGLQVNTDNAVPWGIMMHNKTSPYGGLGMYEDNNGGVHIWNNYNTGSRIYMSPTGGGVLGINNGNVGIGTTNPGYKLDVAGDAHASSFPVSSDIRFKKNIEPLNVSGSVLEKLNNLQGVYFEWNDVYKNLGRGDNKRHIGLIAQEVEKEFPELVSQWGDGSDYRAVDYSRFTAVLLEGLKELNQKLEEFKNKIENNILKVKELIADFIQVKKIRVDKIEMVDQKTGEIYCVWLENGKFQKSKGECK